MADHEHNDFFDALDTPKEHADDMAAMEDAYRERPATLVTGEHRCKLHEGEHFYVKHTPCGHEFCQLYWRYCPRCYGTHEENRIAVTRD